MALNDMLQRARGVGAYTGVHDPDQMRVVGVEPGSPQEAAMQDPRVQYLTELLGKYPLKPMNRFADAMDGTLPPMLLHGKEIPSEVLGAPAYRPADSRAGRR